MGEILIKLLLKLFIIEICFSYNDEENNIKKLENIYQLEYVFEER